MNGYTTNEVIGVLENILNTPYDSRYWQDTWSVKVQGDEHTISIDNSYSYQDLKDKLFVVKSTGIVEMDMELLKQLIATPFYYRYNPFIQKFNVLRSDKFESLLEIEMNIFTANKVAFCVHRKEIHRGNKHFNIMMSVMDEHSSIVPFRDSHYLFSSYIFEQLSSTHVRATYIAKIAPVPFCHETDERLGLRRHITMINRFFKTLTDLPTNLSDIPPYVVVERNGFEKVLNPYITHDNVILKEDNYTVCEVSRFKNDFNFVCCGKFKKRVKLSLTMDTVVDLVFQDRCKVLESKNNCLLLQKGASTQYDANPDHILFSSFNYSNELALFHFHSKRYCVDEKKSSKVFFFNDVYLMFMRDVDGMWEVQFSFDATEKTGVLSVDVIRIFMTNFEHRLDDKTQSIDSSNSPTVHFAYDPSYYMNSSTFADLYRATFQRICSYLSYTDLKNLSCSSKQVRALVLSVMSSEETQSLNSNTSQSSEESGHSETKASPLLPSIAQLVKSNTLSSPNSPGLSNTMSSFSPTFSSFNNGFQPSFQQSVKESSGSVQLPSVFSELPSKSVPLVPQSIQRLSTLTGCSSYSLQSECEVQNSGFRVLEGHTNVIRSIDFSPDNSVMVSGSSDRKIRTWDLNTFPISGRVLIGPNSSVVNTVFMSQDTICVGYKCGTIKYINSDNQKTIVFDSASGRLEGFFPLKGMDFVAWNDNVQIINYNNFKQKVIFTYPQHSKKVTVVKQFKQNEFISGSADRTVHIWETQSEHSKISEIKPHKSGVAVIDVIDQNRFCTVGSEKVLSVWDDRMLKIPVVSIDNRVDVVCVKNGVLACGCDDNTIKFYETKEMKEITSVLCNTGDTTFSALNMKGKVVVGGGRNGNLFIGKCDFLCDN
ncbi:F-box and WD domain protein, putative [Entamoeba invadens IP1]|uniref:F-box and WD domain protein, putative n=1 Tax=Entamoeba invadens IP1 TaxID=370355 RepID=A0A0A1TW50_ENTIV|nr:F-box and WD domain protein, putative [Entamoeba invadens IP1]ELP83508.1 F-box and WD domain protein, putative [Entamoeba invadens IP1]|eukprot:XP_004182854.1 F-box and WD domain protein, putative [Entamoeba invadens IP1]